ncbi:ADC synthase [Peziza echinospora]|nr:ADC synthase [Peziza echinospora]
MGGALSRQAPLVASPPTETPHAPRILLLDFYDSFTHNLAALLRSSTGAVVDVVSHDRYSTLLELQADLSYYDALVIGPGPGSPDDQKDIGIAKEMWTTLPKKHLLPVFGVCLGLQSLCLAFGGQLKRLEVVKHGIISPVTHTGTDIFEGVKDINAVRYHSLHVDMRGVVGGEMEELAWVVDGGENGKVLMAARHKTRPYWAVQYHPESVCTEGGGERVVRNWWRLACEWNARNGRTSRLQPAVPNRGMSVKPRSLLERAILRQNSSAIASAMVAPEIHQVHYTTILAPQLLPAQICEILGAGNQSNDFVFLDSAAAPGRYSIIGVVSEVSTQILRYHAGAANVELSTLGQLPRIMETTPLQVPGTIGGCIWEFLAKFMAKKQVPKEMGPAESPFWGGLIGYISYEMGVQSLDISVGARKAQRPDVQLMYIQRSIVVDNWSRNVYIQTLREGDEEWLESTKSMLQLAAEMPITPSPTPPLNFSSNISSASAIAEALSKASLDVPKSAVKIIRPQKERYISNIRKAQEYLAAGHSYELCLTALTEIHLPLPSPNAWTLFTNLRARNPAPYAAYMRFPDVTIVSSSPERFLSWTRDGLCQLRPIKGTVKKTSTTTLEYAKSILYTQKEMAENLMIVDLIRHDLNQVAHEGSVRVEKLMQVEEYKSVYQLVSVIEGRVGPLPSSTMDKAERNPKASVSPPPVTGFDVLARSLPPGSMTGAPKKRSVELLQGLEGEERGIYSGVMGYWSVCGGGDWSVIIRTAFRYDDENGIKRPDNAFNTSTTNDCQRETTARDSEIWRIGAGGAITALSDPEGEWDEMEVKLESTLRAFIG